MSLEPDNIERLYVNDPRISVGYESWALETYLTSLEQYLSFAHDQYRLQASRQLAKRASNLDPDELNHEQRKIDDAAEKQIPRFFRMGALIPIWGLFESSVVDITRYVGQREEVDRPFKTESRDDFCSKAKEYFENVLRVTLPWTDDEQEGLDRLRRVRNFVAHCNGRLMDLEQDERKKTYKKLATPSLSFEDGNLMVSADYIKEVAALVIGVLTKLSRLIADRYGDPVIPDSEI